eukprot:scaffold301707_cov31-Tisochrysis_lutea.AAC.1
MPAYACRGLIGSDALLMPPEDGTFSKERISVLNCSLVCHVYKRAKGQQGERGTHRQCQPDTRVSLGEVGSVEC